MSWVTEDDLQRALDENPTSATARLVLADWLEEMGDVRAECVLWVSCHRNNMR